jgi:hypothetical protein
MGLVNLFADTTYEGGASLNGPFLATLGASAAAVSLIAGLGEFLGYGLRSLSGFVADRTGRHWPVTFVGYSINLLAVPAMALATSWHIAAALVLAERIGRAIRKPTVEAMLSYSTGKHGRGWVYAVNTAMDYLGYGGGWIAGSVTAGLLYERSRTALVVFAVTTLLASAPLFVLAARTDGAAPGQARVIPRS